MPKTMTRGVRNCNPGNIRWKDAWIGLVPMAQRTDKSFCQCFRYCSIELS